MTQIFACKCDSPKIHRLLLDGGKSGNYYLELCNGCYNSATKQFVISEENLD